MSVSSQATLVPRIRHSHKVSPKCASIICHERFVLSNQTLTQGGFQACFSHLSWAGGSEGKLCLLAVQPWIDPIDSSEPWFSHSLNEGYVDTQPPKPVGKNKWGNLCKMLSTVPGRQWTFNKCWLLSLPPPPPSRRVSFAAVPTVRCRSTCLTDFPILLSSSIPHP